MIYNTNIFAAQFNSSMQEYINGLKIEAKKENGGFVDFSVKEGEKIFTTSHIGKKGEKISCTSCHNIDLTTMGKMFLQINLLNLFLQIKIQLD